jgi:hypothetical protein
MSESTEPTVSRGTLEIIQNAVVQLAQSVTDLTTRQAAQVKRARKLAKIAIFGLVLDITLTLLGVILYFKATSNSNNIENNQRNLAVVQEQQKGALCPVFDIILSGFNPKNPNALANPAAYEKTFKSYEGAATLAGCAHHTRGPAK